MKLINSLSKKGELP